MKIVAFTTACVALLTTGCASTVTAIKGRSFGDHPLKSNFVYVATGDRRFAFKFPKRTCVEPQPELAVTIGAKSNPTVGIKLNGPIGEASSDRNFGFADEVVPTGQITTVRGPDSDMQQHGFFALCIARANGDISEGAAEAGYIRLIDATAKSIESRAESKAIAPAASIKKTDAEKLAEMNEARSKVGLDPLDKLPINPAK